MTLKIKIFLALFLASLISIGAIGYEGYSSGKKELLKSADHHLNTTRGITALSVESYFHEIEKQIETFSEEFTVVEAMTDLKKAYYAIDDSEKNNDDLRNFYTSSFLPKLNETSDIKHSDINNFIPNSNRAKYLQNQYIVSNPNPLGSKHKLDKAPDGSQYSKAHEKYHPVIKHYLEAFEYYDIFLIDHITGDIIYSVYKEVDFATNLLTGPYRESNLAKIFKKSSQSHQKNDLKVIDFAPYQPSYMAAASFIASPIFNGEEEIGILVFQMPISHINDLVTYNHKWEENGFGKSGESYIVADNYTVRTEQRPFIENPAEHIKHLEKAGMSSNELHKIEVLGSTNGIQKVKNRSIEQGIMGKTGISIVKNFDNDDVLSSYAPLKIEGVNWVIVSEMHLDEVLKPIDNLFWNISLITFILLVFITIFALYFAKSIINPILKANLVLQKIAMGDFSEKLEIKGKDEISNILSQINITSQNISNTLKADKIDWVQLQESLKKADLLGNVISGTTTNFSICDNDFNITFINPALEKLFNAHINEFASVFPGFSTADVVGSSIDRFHKNPQQQRRLLKEGSSYSAQISILELSIELNMIPIIDTRGEKIGTAVEWTNLTPQLTFNNEMQKVVEAASMGDLQTKGDISILNELYAPTMESTNQLLDIINAPIQEIKSVLSKVSGGDLSELADSSFKGEFGLLADSLNITIENLNELLTEVISSGNQISHGAKELAASTQTVSQGATESSASLEEITASMSEINSQTHLNADNSTIASKLSQTAKENTQRGNEQMKEMTTAMEGIDNASNDISRIIKVIDEIAFQTNLLALNAAVEAARAGVHGKGFAVVAEEVRNLAARSATAAKETTQLIETSIARVSTGINLTKESREGLDQIFGSINKVTDLVKEISISSNEQAQGISQVNQGLSQLDAVTQQNSAAAEESASATYELEGQADNLNKMMTRFKLKQGNLPSAF